MTWPSVPLGAICSPKQHPTISTAELTTEGYPAFGANGQIGFYKTFTHDKATIAITCRGATCGTVNIVPAYSYISGNAMALDKLDLTRIDLSFLSYALQIRGFADVISGSAQPQITRGPLLDVRVPVPPLLEQRRISAILSQADELRGKRRDAIALLENLPAAIFLEMFGDPTNNPRKWPYVEFGALAHNEDGKRRPLKLSDRAEIAGEYPYYGASGVIDYVNSYLFDGQRLLIGEDGANLITRSSPIAFIATGKFWANNHAHVLASSGKAELRFLEHYILSISLVPYVTGSAQPKLTQKSLNELKVFCPPLDMQKCFAERLKEVDMLKDRTAVHLARLDALFVALQHQAFVGELSTPQAERELELAG